MKDSSETFHPIAPEGKKANLLPWLNLEEPSYLPVNVSRYLLLL
jgi:hypothetical protein